MTDNESALQYASLGRRALGHIIDNFFLTALLIPVFLFPETIALVHLVLWLLFIPGYTLFIEGLWGGRSVGKYVMDMKVVKDDGTEIGLLDSFERNAVGLVGWLFIWFGLLVGVFAIHQSQENKRLGDSFAGTVVVEVE